tara:strand:- start:144 stop:635 length:492 start_codon:yes stop_codon:yes gene_type:complete
MKSIIIIRHANSNIASPSQSDFERSLNDIGVKDAEIMGDILMDRKTYLDAIISSSANRALSTATIIAKQIQFQGQIYQKRSLYGASVNELLNIISELDNSLNSIAIVGHNPTLHILSEMLSDEKILKFPTCSIIKINFQIESWKNCFHGALEYFIFPDLFKNI